MYRETSTTAMTSTWTREFKISSSTNAYSQLNSKYASATCLYSKSIRRGLSFYLDHGLQYVHEYFMSLFEESRIQLNLM